MKQCQVLKFKRLMSYRKDVHPSYLSFFPEDEEEFIKQLTVQQLQDYIAMHQKIFKNSKRQWKKRLVEGVPSITVWFQRIVSNRPQIRCTKRQHHDQVSNTLVHRVRRRQTAGIIFPQQHSASTN